jgi:hypothetical protein
MWVHPRTPTGYLIAMVIVFAILNALAWLVDAPPFRERFGVSSAGFLLGARSRRRLVSVRGRS